MRWYPGCSASCWYFARSFSISVVSPYILSPRKINRSGSALIIESQMGCGWNCFAQEPKAIFCNGVSAADRHGLQAERRINAAHLDDDFIRLKTKTYQNDLARLIFF